MVDSYNRDSVSKSRTEKLIYKNGPVNIEAMAYRHNIALQPKTFQKESLFPYKCQSKAKSSDIHATNNGEITHTNAFGQRNVWSLQPQAHKMSMHSRFSKLPNSKLSFSTTKNIYKPILFFLFFLFLFLKKKPHTISAEIKWQKSDPSLILTQQWKW